MMTAEEIKKTFTPAVEDLLAAEACGAVYRARGPAGETAAVIAVVIGEKSAAFAERIEAILKELRVRIKKA